MLFIRHFIFFLKASLPLKLKKTPEKLSKFTPQENILLNDQKNHLPLQFQPSRKRPHSFSKSSLSSRNLSRKNLSLSPSLPVLPGKLQPPMEKNLPNRQTTPTCLAVASLHYLPLFLPPSSFRPISPTTLHHYLANNRRRSLIQQPADLHATCQPSIGTSKTTYDSALPSQKETRD